jgi:phosphogluconate dehydratase
MSLPLHPVISKVIDDIETRSYSDREAYKTLMRSQVKEIGERRKGVGCGNLAHVCAALSSQEKNAVLEEKTPHFGIITSYNDMLSAHAPYKDFPDFITSAAHDLGATVQVASGVPAMCDGVTQGQLGMDLSLFSRDVIALSTAIGLSHNVFDGVFYLGICDKIVPGLLMGAARFGFLPSLFIPSGPMTSGQDNSAKAAIRKSYAEGKASRQELLLSEMASYHGRGTCTFYGTANTNQVMLEAMGLQLPASSFVPVDTSLRNAYTKEAVQTLIHQAQQKLSLYEIVDAKTLVNAIVAIVATGGSTNHTLHMPAIAKAFGYTLTWDDFEKISRITPLLCRLYPNGKADINHFHAAGGTGFIFKTLIESGLMAKNALTMMGIPLENSLWEGSLKENGEFYKKPIISDSLDQEILRSVDNPFEKEGGIICVKGNLGRAILKQSAVSPENRSIAAPASIFWSQEAVIDAYRRNELFKDMVVVLLGQGAGVKGMPELHQLMPYLVSVQDQGYKIALLTDGRLSGASGKILCAIHCSPEYPKNDALQQLRNGDLITIDCASGIMESQSLGKEPSPMPMFEKFEGLGRELFEGFRKNITSAEAGASFILS